jgi:hypothetical protein
VTVVFPASMWAMIPMLRVRASGMERPAVSVLTAGAVAIALTT